MLFLHAIPNQEQVEHQDPDHMHNEFSATEGKIVRATLIRSSELNSPFIGIENEQIMYSAKKRFNCCFPESDI